MRAWRFLHVNKFANFNPLLSLHISFDNNCKVDFFVQVKLLLNVLDFSFSFLALNKQVHNEIIKTGVHKSLHRQITLVFLVVNEISLFLLNSFHFTDHFKIKLISVNFFQAITCSSDSGLSIGVILFSIDSFDPLNDFSVIEYLTSFLIFIQSE